MSDNDPPVAAHAGLVDAAVFVAVGEERSGVVAQFDEGAGLGAVVDGEGRRFEFHCTQIADGSRTIEVDRPVHFSLQRTNLGRIEATSIRLADKAD